LYYRIYVQIQKIGRDQFDEYNAENFTSYNINKRTILLWYKLSNRKHCSYYWINTYK